MSDYIRASDGNGEPDRAYVVVSREVGDMLLNVDSVLNFPHKGIATSGMIDQATGLIDPNTASVFYYTLSGSMIHIDKFAPGYIDTGNTEGETVLLKPTTSWADEVSEGVNEALEAVGEMQGEIDAMQAEVDTIPAKVDAAMLPIHTDEANNRIGINKVPTQGALDVDGDIYSNGQKVLDEGSSIPAQSIDWSTGQKKITGNLVLYMNASQSVTLNEPVSAQPNGIILVWSVYSSGAPQDYGWNYSYVPKYHAQNNPGQGIYFAMVSSGGSALIRKYVYVNNTTVTGNDINSTAPNSNLVLRHIIGY